MLIPAELKTFFYLLPIDFRKSIDGLAQIIKEHMQQDIVGNRLFLFRNKRGDKIKALNYSHHCFSLIYCRLEKGKWIFPKGDSGHLELSQAHLKWILSSHRYSKIEALTEENYTNFF